MDQVYIDARELALNKRLEMIDEDLRRYDDYEMRKNALIADFIAGFDTAHAMMIGT